jgi:gamma-glutamylcyclotransferase (GGCT)/AIG2-like uncharacterized protein YtfP
MPVSRSQLPFFVYGTLMSGFGNHKLYVEGAATAIHRAVACGMELYHLGKFPAAIRRGSTASASAGATQDEMGVKLYGELVWGPSDPTQYAKMQSSLDTLECYREGAERVNLYNRTIIQVFCPDTNEVCDAWMYEFNQPERAAACHHVTHGDWRRFIENREWERLEEPSRDVEDRECHIDKYARGAAAIGS